jgi:hypothetical protein
MYGLVNRESLCMCRAAQGFVMPRGPRGDMRPDRDIGRASPIFRTHTSKAYSEKLTTGERSQNAKKATAARWR